MKVLYSLAEKTIATYVQVLAALLIAGATINLSTAQAAAMAAIPAALTVVANGLSSATIGRLPFYVDLLLRTGRTFAVTFLGVLIAQPIFQLDRSAAMAAILGAIPAALAVIKAALATRVGAPTSAALLPVSLDPAA